MAHRSAPPKSSVTDCHVDTALVRQLLIDQCPALAGDVQPFALGWDNVIFRVAVKRPCAQVPGQLLVRMPRHAQGSRNVKREQAWLPLAAQHLRVPTPIALHHGLPGCGYPHHWSVVPYVQGTPAADAVFEPQTMSQALVKLLTSLHRPSPTDAPAKASRSDGLGSKQALVGQLLSERRVVAVDAADGLARIWNKAVNTAKYSGPAVWVHGDLHPYNLLVHQGRLASVLDWGDVFGGDPSVDYAAAWMLLDPEHHGPIRQATSDQMWWRGTGWALYFALVLRRAVLDGAGAGLGQVSTITLNRLLR